MPLEPVDHLDDLVVTNPTDTDPVSEGDNHIRNLKIALAAGVTGNADETRLLVQGLVKALAVATGFDIRTPTDALIALRMLNTDVDVGLALQLDEATGAASISETDGGGASVVAWINFIRGGGVNLLHIGSTKISTVAGGVAVVGQATVTEAAPVGPSELTRKDYVDTLVAAVQADLDNVKNGFAFTGPISAPTVTEV